jgi:hypothetical protein
VGLKAPHPTPPNPTLSPPHPSPAPSHVPAPPLEGKPQLDYVSKSQSVALASVVKQSLASLSADEKGELVVIVSGIPWVGSDYAETMTLLTQRKKDCSHRRGQQDYMTFVAFIKATSWELMLAEDTSSDAVLHEIITTLIRGGCRCAKEHTLKLAASLWMLICDHQAFLFMFQIYSELHMCTLAYQCCWRRFKQLG